MAKKVTSESKKNLFAVNRCTESFKKNFSSIFKIRNKVNVIKYKKNTLISVDLILLKNIKNKSKGSTSAR